MREKNECGFNSQDSYPPSPPLPKKTTTLPSILNTENKNRFVMPPHKVSFPCYSKISPCRDCRVKNCSREMTEQRKVVQSLLRCVAFRGGSSRETGYYCRGCELPLRNLMNMFPLITLAFLEGVLSATSSRSIS